MNQDAVINELLERGVVRREEVRGRYRLCHPRTTEEDRTYRRNDLLAMFAIESSYCSGDYRLNIEAIRLYRTEVVQETLRRLIRLTYHSAPRDYESALASIPYDEDGVRRSFGIEYEIYALTEAQEDKLARLLDTLPAHVVERDGSLASTGCEIIFAPVGAEDYIRIVTKLKNFIVENGVRMQDSSEHMAGMHTTYGVSNSVAERSDLQIRLNRFALAVKAVATRRQITKMFGRDFGFYRELPRDTATTTHGNAFSTNGRPRTCWECRLPAWNCDPEKLVQFFKVTEVAFYRPIQATDFDKVFEIFGEAQGA